MDKNIDKTIITHITTSKYFYVLLAAIAMVNYFFLSMHSDEYLFILIKILNDYRYVLLFFVPISLLINMCVYSFLNENPEILMRLKDRKQYIKIIIKNSIYITIYVWLLNILLLIIEINFVKHTGIQLYKIPQIKAWNISIFLVSLFRILAVMIVMQIINLSLMLGLKRKIYAFIITILIISLSVVMTFISSKSILYIFLISSYTHNIFVFKNLVEAIVLSSFVYLMIFYISRRFLYKRTCNIDLVGEEKR
ncbi:MAG: hypothetical protein RSB51_01610 [Clostridia bacterium]